MAITGTTCWGHESGVTQTNFRTFTGNWTGTGSIIGVSGDSESLRIDTDEYMECQDIVNTGAVDVTLAINQYDSGDTVTIQYRTAATEGGVSGASYTTYTAPFTSLGYVQVRLSSPGCADSSCSGFLICQNFEGSGTDNSETWTDENGSPNRDYTTEHLRGDQSLYLAEYAIIVSPTFTATGELWIHFMLQVDTRTSHENYKSILEFGEQLVYVSENETLLLRDGTRYDYGTATITTGTTYHVWVYYKKATSGDGITRAYIGTSTTIPAEADCEFTNGVSTADITQVKFRASGGDGLTIIVDQILIKAGSTAPSPVCD